MADDYSDLMYTMAGVRRSNPYDRKRAFAQQMLASGADFSPVQHPLQGAARLAQALVGGWMGHRADEDEAAQVKKGQDALAAAMAEPDPQKRIALLAASNPDIAARGTVQLALEQAKKGDREQQASVWATGHGGMPQQAPSGPQIQTATLPPPPGTDPAANAIAGIESSGLGYGAVGPVANKQGDRAYGKFQVMGANIGPWTQEILGKAMSPQEFLQNPQAQEAVFKAKFGQYTQKYGSEEAAARAWFAGEGGMNNPNARDVNGMTVAQYGQKFQAGMPAQGDQPQPGMPPAPQGQGPAVYAPPDVPNVPRPTPAPQTVQRLRQAVASGALTPQQAEAELNSQIDREWSVQRERAKMEYDRKLGDYNLGRKQEAELTAKAPLELIQQRTKNYEENIRPKAEAAASEIVAMHQMKQLLDAGAITGTGAGARVEMQKFAQTLGIPWGNDQVANTAALQSAVGQRVLALVKNLGAGSGISNADREYAAKVAGGEISMTEASMRRIMDIGERAARDTLKNHDAEVTRLMKLPGVAGLGQDYFGVQKPPTYEEWTKANPLVRPPAAPTPPPPGAPAPGTDLSAAAGRRAAEVSGDPRFAPPGGQEPPMLTSPEQAKNLPSGTVFRTPDGRLKRVP